MGLKIGDVAERGGVNLQTIRYYEREGLLPEPPASRVGLSPVSRSCGAPGALHQTGARTRLFAG